MSTSGKLTVSFLTVERDDLVDMTVRLMNAIETGILSDPVDPLHIAVNGTSDSGKSLVSDIVRDIFLGYGSSTLDSRKDEYTTGLRYAGHYQGAPLEIYFMNASCADPLMIQGLMKRRTAGGITFLQNMYDSPEMYLGRGIVFPQDVFNVPEINLGMRLYIESHFGRPRNYRPLRQDVAPASLQKKFSEMNREEKGTWRNKINSLFAWKCEQTSEKNWNRYVEIEVTDRRLLKSDVFRKAFAAFCPQHGKSQPQVYGRDFPCRSP